MGREATCQIQWAAESGLAKVLLETRDLVVRGSGNLRRRAVPIASLTQITVEGSLLRFRAGEDEVSLDLGSEQARNWAKKLTNPPPTLAVKLGISAQTRLAFFGELESEEIQAAISQGKAVKGREVDLLLAGIATPDGLREFLATYRSYPSQPPFWIIYPKGPRKPLPETEIRSALRSLGFIDTKVASVSATHTALRFIKRG